MSMNELFWQAKLAAWVHDPVEKALVLFREAHERGTVRNLCLELFGSERIPDHLAGIVREADRWSAAADRPDIPWKPGTRYPEWSKVSFSGSPELIHPVSPGVRINIRETFHDASVDELKAVSTDHFRNLIVLRHDSRPDMRNTFLRFWRFGSETPATGLNLLWQLLPADTRSPDHTIWDHLKLCSIFSGIFALDDEPTLLVVSLGPVQGFIAQARSTSDLWAGSHFLSQLAWQSILPIVEEFGPDAILFPDLHGVPVVDQWLADQGLWPDDRLKPWEYEDREGKTETVVLDRDQRMSAALPNRFVAVVPSKEVREITSILTDKVREYALEQAVRAAKKFFGDELPDIAKEQIEKQMKGFPEIYWSSVPWSVVKGSDGKVDSEKLFDMLKQFLADGADISTEGTWDILAKPVKSKSGEWKFYEPNRGAAYTHMYTLADRIHSAVKTVRPFEGVKQEGYRCTICGEREWLTDDRALLDNPPGQRDASRWSILSRNGGHIRKGEHLCAWCTLKRFWPSVFPESVGAESKRRFVVSTHTMALAPSIEVIVDKANAGLLKERVLDAVNQLAPAMDAFGRPAIPRRLWRKIEQLAESDKTLSDVLSRLPAFLDFLSDAEDMGVEIREDKKRAVNNLLGGSPETYYALVLMDGDRMGEWVSGMNPDQLPRYRDVLHSKTANILDEEFHNDNDIQNFLNAKRPNSPARHQAISRTLNRFSINLARVVVEEIFTGKLIYAGGDDLLAMVSVHDLPGLMLALRSLYSGVMIDSEEKWKKLTSRETEHRRLSLRNGYALLYEKGKKYLYATMGPMATASMGAVIAHHKAPLGRVLRSLRTAEQMAKDRGGRNAFCITIEKRAGGKSQLIGKWWNGNPEDSAPMETTLGTLMRLRDALAEKGVSRRAAYVMHDILRDLPPDHNAISGVMAFRLNRQGMDEKIAGELAKKIVNIGFLHKGISESKEENKTARGETPPINKWLQDFFITAEFLARRMESTEGGDAE